MEEEAHPVPDLLALRVLAEVVAEDVEEADLLGPAPLDRQALAEEDVEDVEEADRQDLPALAEADAVVAEEGEADRITIVGFVLVGRSDVPHGGGYGLRTTSLHTTRHIIPITIIT